jgi:hypothetical protein
METATFIAFTMLTASLFAAGILMRADAAWETGYKAAFRDKPGDPPYYIAILRRMWWRGFSYGCAIQDKPYA